MKHFYFNCLMAVFAMFFSVQLQGQTTVAIDGIKYELDGIYAYVVGYTAKPVDITIPEIITENGLTYKVTSLKTNCFSDCTSLVSVQINPSTLIKEGCFKGCTKLKRVRMRKRMYIYDNAFSGCNSLEVVEFGNEPIHFYGRNIFDNCTNLKYLVIPEGSYIYANFCHDCPRLQSIIY